MIVVVTNVNRLQMAKARCQVMTHLTFLLVIQESVNGMLIVSANGTVWDNEHIRGQCSRQSQGLEQRKKTEVSSAKRDELIGLGRMRQTTDNGRAD